MRLTPALSCLPLISIFVSTACPSTTEPTDDATVGAEMGSSDTGADTGTDTGGEASISVTGLARTHQNEDPMMASSVTATVEADGVKVEHTDLWENCCFMPFASAAVVEQTVNVSYMNNGEDCDCECAWTVTYTLEGLTPGTWTIAVPGASTDVTVE